MIGALWFFFFGGVGEPPVVYPGYAVVRDVMPIGGRLLVQDLPDKLSSEVMGIAFDLRPILRGGRAVTSVTFATRGGFPVASQSRVDGTKVACTVSGGFCGEVVEIVATAVLSDGSVVAPWGTMRVKRAGAL